MQAGDRAKINSNTYCDGTLATLKARKAPAPPVTLRVILDRVCASREK
jgi:hypothetical protein